MPHGALPFGALMAAICFGRYTDAFQLNYSYRRRRSHLRADRRLRWWAAYGSGKGEDKAGHPAALTIC